MVEVRDPDTFVRPIYAGNALATVKALGQGPRLLTVRPTAFAAAPASGGSAAVEAVSADELAAAQQTAGSSEWVGEDVRKSGARCVLGGGSKMLLGHAVLLFRANNILQFATCSFPITPCTHSIHPADRPELAQARVVVSGGRALKSAENFSSLLGVLADRLGAALGASRAAVDAGYAPNDLQVGCRLGCSTCGVARLLSAGLWGAGC